MLVLLPLRLLVRVEPGVRLWPLLSRWRLRRFLLRL